MATGTPAPRRGLRAAIGRWLANRSAADVVTPIQPGPPLPTPTNDLDEHLADPVTLAALAGTQSRPIRSRAQVYEKWQDMVADPIIGSAMRLHVTAALGGHESKGKMVFIEASEDVKATAKKAAEKKGKGAPPKDGAEPELSGDEALVAELARELEPLFNRIAPTLCFNAVTFGDGYGRIYGKAGTGVLDVYTDELVYPPLVQPFERGNRTVGYLVSTSSRFSDRLTLMQMVRMKMPRLMYVPQSRVQEKALRTSLRVDDLEELPLLPALAGGSFLDGAERAYDKFSAAWAGLVGQRVQGSIDETLIGVNQANMNPVARKRLRERLSEMFDRSNRYINKVVSEGWPIFGKIYHFIPTSDEKQLAEIRGAASVGRAQNYEIEDVLMHGKFLAGALGLDLSMLGFSDLLSGGLGDGGFFRVSAQSAERSRAIRASLTEALDHIIEVHLLLSRGIDLTGQPKPWTINYFSGISALETERAKTKADNMNSAALLVSTLMQLKELRLDETAMRELLKVQCGLDETEARLYAKGLAKAIEEAKKAEKEQNAGFGGGDGGGDGGGMPFGAAGPGDPKPGEEPIEPAEG